MNGAIFFILGSPVYVIFPLTAPQLGHLFHFMVGNLIVFSSSFNNKKNALYLCCAFQETQRCFTELTKNKSINEKQIRQEEKWIVKATLNRRVLGEVCFFLHVECGGVSSRGREQQ